MTSVVLITIFGLCLGIVPGYAMRIFRELLSKSQELWAKYKSFFVQTVETLKKDGEQLVKKGGQEVKEVMEELTHEVKRISDKVASGVSFHESNCRCMNCACGCFFTLVVQQISLNDTGCLGIAYLPNEYGFEFTFKLNDKLAIDSKISVKNLPPICATSLFIVNLASLCLRFYGDDDHIFPGCAALEAKVDGVLVKSFELGCFKICAR